MMKAVFILGMIWVMQNDSLAQTGFTIRGSVADSAGIALYKATIRLTSAKDTLFSLTKEDGTFVIAGVPAREGEVLVTMHGYRDVRKQFSVGAGSRVLMLPAVVLPIDYRELDPVTVSRVRPITIGEDTLSYHAAAFAVRAGSEVEALLKILPGVEVDMNGNVIVQGKKIVRVMVDGKDFFGGDVLTATRNLPADIVDKIQVIDDYGDKARLTGVKSGESVKVLNIVLKADKRNGQFGHVQGGQGTQSKYTRDVFGNSFKNDRQISVIGKLENNSPAGNNYLKSTGVNYAGRWNKKWEGNSSLNLGGNNTASAGSIVQDNYYSTGQLHQEQSNQARGNSRNGNLQATVTNKPDAYHTLRISPSITLQRSGQSVQSGFSTSQQDSAFAKKTAGNSLSQSLTKGFAAGSDLYYEQLSHRSKRRFSAQVNGQYAANRQTNDNLVNIFSQADSIRSRSLVHYLVDNTSASWTIHATANYFAPLGKAGFLELGYDWSNSLSQNDRLTRQPDSMHTEPGTIDSLSSVYSLHSSSQRLHIGYSAHFEHLNLSLSLDGQPGSMSGTSTSGKGGITRYHYCSFLPVAQFSWTFTHSRSLSFQYSASPGLPGLSQLQTLTDLSNPQYPVMGNPSLKPAFNQDVNLHYEQSTIQPTQFQGFGVSLGYNTTQNAIIISIVHPHDSGAVIQRTGYLNANGFYSYHADCHLTLPALLHKHIRITVDGNLSHTQAVSMTDNVLYPTINQSWTQGLHLQYILPGIIESEISGNYNVASTRYPSVNTSPTSFSSAGWNLENRHYLWRQWILSYAISQNLTSARTGGLKANPALLSGSFQRQFLAKNRATISLVGYDLLNGNSGVAQLVSATSVTRSQAVLTGRYFMLSFLWKWGKFGE